MYLTAYTRPDILFAVERLSPLLREPFSALHDVSQTHLSLYWRNQIYGSRLRPRLFFGSCWLLRLKFGRLQRVSQTYWRTCFLMSGGTISWRPEKKSVEALYSSEDEYISACTAAKEAIWLSNVVKSLSGSHSPKSASTLVDNQRSIESAHNLFINSRNKHIDTFYHNVFDAVASNKGNALHILSSEQAADMPTKPLLRVLF